VNAGVMYGFRDARRIIGASAAAAIAVASWLLIGIAGALERPATRALGSGSSEPSLIEAATFGVVLPLASYALSARVDGTRDELMNAYWARHGISRRLYALGRIGFCAAFGAFLMITGATLAFALSQAIFGEAAAGALAFAAVISIAALGALAYAACFGLAQLVGGGLGRAAFLVADWLLGAGAGVAALPWPRAHLRSLLGGPTVAGMSPHHAALFLVCLTLTGALLCMRRVPP
jgi:hypothetical protein